MDLDVSKLRRDFRRFASWQMKNLMHRGVNPARYILDLARLRSSRRLATNKPPIRFALISDREAYCSEEQFNPFSVYRAQLRTKLRLASVHLYLKDVLRVPKALSGFDMVGLKLSYHTEPHDALRIVKTIRRACEEKYVLYFDGDDDLGIQWPDILPYVDLYIKKHVFRDSAGYLRRYVGKSNLHDYVHRTYGHVFTLADYKSFVGDKDTMISESGPVAADQVGKIKLGYNLALDRLILKLYSEVRDLPPPLKEYDVVFRGNVPLGVWIAHLRNNVTAILKNLEGSYRVILPTSRVSPQEYNREMLASRICVSPFGFGEICWRDFEAILCRSLLIKPDMSHVRTNPDIFRPYETYVPVKWDYSDLEEKCVYYLANDDERQTIVQNAFKVLESFYRSEGFIATLSTIIEQLGIDGDQSTRRTRWADAAETVPWIGVGCSS